MSHQHFLLPCVASAPEPILVQSSVRSVDPQAPSGRSDLKAAHSPELNESLHLAQLLSSRICHDLIGPVGIAAATDDLRDAEDRIDEEALTLIADSARSAAHRLALFRFAFGFTKSEEGVTSSMFIISLVNRALKNSRLQFDWPSMDPDASMAETSIPSAAARLLVCLVLIATEALPRGGVISLRLSRSDGQLAVMVRATGRGARTPDAALEAYRAHSCAGITPRTVVGFYAGKLAAQMGAVVKVGSESGNFVEITVAIAPPAGASRRQIDDQGRLCDRALSDT